MNNQYFSIEMASTVHAEIVPTESWPSTVQDMRDYIRATGGSWIQMLGASMGTHAENELDRRGVNHQCVDMDFDKFREAAQPPMTDDEVIDLQVGFKNFGGILVNSVNTVNVNDPTRGSHV